MAKNLNLNKQKPIVELKKISKSYGKSYELGHLPVLRDITLSIGAGEFVCLIGPSGCGKSTLLKSIARLEPIDSGYIGAPQNISMVFQSGALLPWLTVYENAAFGLYQQKKPLAEIAKVTEKFLELVGLHDFAKKYPRELSGGQRQRVGIARALAVKPALLLLDEPFSALDPKTTEELHTDLLKIWKETRVTILMVSHLIEEAVSLADRVVLMKSGAIEEVFPITLPYPRREQTMPFSKLTLTIRKQFFA